MPEGGGHDRVADMTKEAGKVIALKSSDGDVFMIEKAMALELQTIKDIIKDGCANNSIPLPNVTGRILSKVIEYCKKHIEATSGRNPEEEVKLWWWDANFVQVDLGTLFDLVRAADYLNIKSLFDLTYQTGLDMIKAADFLINRRPLDLKCKRVADMIKEAGKVITLKSFDGELFMIEKAVALESQTIKDMIKDGCTDNCIPLPNVTSRILSKVIVYCKKHVEAAGGRNPMDEMKLRWWDANFVRFDDLATLFDLVRAADYLNIESLLDLTCQTAADMIKIPEDNRRMFNFKYDFTGEEEDEVRGENQWGLGSPYA